jgi:hypothetical protein
MWLGGKGSWEAFQFTVCGSGRPYSFPACVCIGCHFLFFHFLVEPCVLYSVT